MIKKQQQGFTLVTVLILTSMASIVVLNSLRENVVQERLSGNFQKKINSRLLAEKGVFKEAKLIQQALDADSSLDIDGLIAATGSTTGVGLIGDDATYNASITKNAAGELEIASIGERYDGDAQSNLVARYGFTPGKGGSPFSNAIVGCEGVTLSGSGRIDSYDSSKGDYDPSKAEASAVVGTIYKNTDITLSGASPIWGSVHATGSIYFSGSSPIIGSLKANNSIEIDSNFTVSAEPLLPEGFPLDTAVGGDVLSGGDVTWKQGKVLGVIRANNDLIIPTNTASTILVNKNNDELDIMYGGSLLAGSLAGHLEQDGIPYSDSKYKVHPHVEPIPEQDPANFEAGKVACDPMDISTLVSDLVDLSSKDILIEHGSSSPSTDDPNVQVVYQLTPMIGESQIENAGSFTWMNWMGQRPPTLIYDLVNVAKESNVKILKSKDFIISNGVLKVSGGDVSLIVDGDFIMKGASKINIDEGSSLTLYISGVVNINAAGGEIIMPQGLTESNKPVFSIYSSYQEANGIYISANSNIYAAIYAPKTDVNIAANGDFSGSVRGKTVTVSGSGAIHYDTNLSIAGGGNTGKQGAIKFLGWSYKTPSTAADEPKDEETTP